MQQIDEAKAAVAQIIGQLRRSPVDMLLVGGIVPVFLITDIGFGRPRQTEDIDIVVDIETRPRFYDWEERLRRAGFLNDRSPGAPICRWRLGELVVDFMPTNPDILKFSNRWYVQAMRNGTIFEFAPQKSMKMITAPYFVATKIEAFLDRGKGDYLLSKDIEDIITLVDGRPELGREIVESPAELRAYLAFEFSSLLASSDFLDSISGHLLPDSGSQARESLIQQRMGEIAALAA